MFKIFCILFFFQMCSGNPAYSKIAPIKPIKPEKVFVFTEKNNIVTWQATGNPGFLKISGHESHAVGEIQLTNGFYTGNLVVDLRSFKTDINLRDEHMQNKYLETQKFPMATLRITNVDLEKKGEFKGDLTLKNVSREVTGIVSKVDQKIMVLFDISLRDFEIGIPNYLGVTVAEKVSITVMADLNEKK